MDTIIQSLVLLLIGMGVVFAALLVLAGLIWAFRAADDLLGRRKLMHERARLLSRIPEPEEEIESETDDEVIAVIAAAITSALRHPISVRRVRFLGPTPPSGVWAVSGRINIMASHLISKRNPHS